MAKKIIDLIYPELCYQIVGILFEVYNQLGNGYEEKIYQKAIAEALKQSMLKFREQVYLRIDFKGKKVGKCYLDFLIEEKVVLEIKKGNHFSTVHIKQVYKYLVNNDFKLGILAYFAPRGVHYKRIVNVRN